jgi:hypothetical protein
MKYEADKNEIKSKIVEIIVITNKETIHSQGRSLLQIP